MSTECQVSIGGNPKLRKIKNFGIQKFILSALSDVENFAEFSTTIIFQIRAKLKEISLENLSSAQPSS